MPARRPRRTAVTLALTAVLLVPARIPKQDGVGDPVSFGSSSPAAVAGYPDITVPAGFAGPRNALPIGISFMGTRWDDADVLDLAAAGQDGGVAEELIVLVDDDGRQIGTMPKPLVHHGETPLHRAFSAYLFGDDGRLLVTRRALDKQTFPGMWTNTVCGHPGPGEDDAAAIARRARFELGLGAADLRPAVPGYRYRAEFQGVVENEICPVYLGRFTGTPAPDPTEVAEWELLDWAAFRTRQETEGDAWSPWCREQARLIEQAGLVPVG